MEKDLACSKHFSETRVHNYTYIITHIFCRFHCIYLVMAPLEVKLLLSNNLLRYLVSYVDLGEAEGLQMNTGSTDGRSNDFHQQFLQILAYEGPRLL